MSAFRSLGLSLSITERYNRVVESAFDLVDEAALRLIRSKVWRKGYELRTDPVRKVRRADAELTLSGGIITKGAIIALSKSWFAVYVRLAEQDPHDDILSSGDTPLPKEKMLAEICWCLQKNLSLLRAGHRPMCRDHPFRVLLQYDSHRKIASVPWTWGIRTNVKIILAERKSIILRDSAICRR